MSLLGTAAQVLGAGVIISTGGVLAVQHKLIGEILDELCLHLYFWRPKKRRRYTARHARHTYWVPQGWDLR